MADLFIELQKSSLKRLDAHPSDCLAPLASITLRAELIWAAYFKEEMHGSADLTTRFGQLDKDGDGKITREELIEELKRSGLSANMVERMLSTYDSNGDGFVTAQEFVDTLTEVNYVRPSSER
ncbi:unnamed protein product [Calicophoron daubneyi]|uniref:EF-hand domain-containing protein n=1 Tax=Calicophoron daubneyi TaxID=300641 RepID=A0AAV2TGZ7_CALDB